MEQLEPGAALQRTTELGQDPAAAEQLTGGSSIAADSEVGASQLEECSLSAEGSVTSMAQSELDDSPLVEVPALLQRKASCASSTGLPRQLDFSSEQHSALLQQEDSQPSSTGLQLEAEDGSEQHRAALQELGTLRCDNDWLRQQLEAVMQRAATEAAQLRTQVAAVELQGSQAAARLQEDNACLWQQLNDAMALAEEGEAEVQQLRAENEVLRRQLDMVLAVQQRRARSAVVEVQLQEENACLWQQLAAVMHHNAELQQRLLGLATSAKQPAPLQIAGAPASPGLALGVGRTLVTPGCCPDDSLPQDKATWLAEHSSAAALWNIHCNPAWDDRCEDSHAGQLLTPTFVERPPKVAQASTRVSPAPAGSPLGLGVGPPPAQTTGAAGSPQRPGQPSVRPGGLGSSAAPGGVASNATADPLGYLDSLLPKSGSRGSMGPARSASGSSLSSATGQPAAKPAVSKAATQADDMDALFADSGFGGSAAAVARVSPAPPAAARQAAADPLNLFGGSLPVVPQQASASSQPQQAGTLDDLLGTGDLLGGFGPQRVASRQPASQGAKGSSREVLPPVPLAAGVAGPASTGDQELHRIDSFNSKGQPPARTAGVLGSGGFGDFLGTDAAHGTYQQQHSHRQPPYQQQGQQQQQQQGVRVSGTPPASRHASSTSLNGHAMSEGSVGQSPARHKAFDYLDEPEQQERPGQAGASGAYGGVADQGYSLSSALGQGAGNSSGRSTASSDVAHTAAEVKQKAAKMFQAGTQWFMRASKNLVKDLQGRQGSVGSSGGSQHRVYSQQQANGSTIEPYYYDWAAQLAKLSPDNRAAALGAMAEEDRLVVQRILDEAALGEAMLDEQHLAYDVNDSPPSSYQQPTSREGSQHGGRRMRNEEPAARPPQAYSKQSEDHGIGYAASDEGGSLSASRSAGSLSRGSAAFAAQTYEDGGENSGVGLAAASAARSPGLAQLQQHYRPQQEAARTAAGSVPAIDHNEEDLLGFAGGPAPAAASPPKPAPQQAMHSAEDDLLGFGSGGSTAAPPTAASKGAPAAAAVGLEDDLMGFVSGAKGVGEGLGAAPSPARHAHIEDMFTVPQSRPAPASGSIGQAAGPASSGASRTAPSPVRPVRKPASSSATGLDSMIDLGAELPAAVDVGEHANLYEGDIEEVEDPNEPEIRKVLRQRRIQEKHLRMQQQLAEKRAREQAEDAEKAGKVELRDTLRPKIDAWAAGKKDNIRALLSSLHTVLWEGSGWTAPNMSDMLDNHKVKRIYMKANLIVHPDKVKQKGGTLEQITIADMVFDVLKMAWGKFEAST
ncbi:hypothetical protein N2152v2_009715 [Parachlorella kessleri]